MRMGHISEYLLVNFPPLNCYNYIIYFVKYVQLIVINLIS